MADVNTKLIPALQQGWAAMVSQDCTDLTNPPACGCTSPSRGRTVIGLFDTNHDCAISVSEVQNNGLVLSALSPDVMVDGEMCISFGVGMHAVKGTFTVP